MLGPPGAPPRTAEPLLESEVRDLPQNQWQNKGESSASQLEASQLKAVIMPQLRWRATLTPRALGDLATELVVDSFGRRRPVREHGWRSPLTTDSWRRMKDQGSPGVQGSHNRVKPASLHGGRRRMVALHRHLGVAERLGVRCCRTRPAAGLRAWNWQGRVIKPSRI
jgi:hypothetical protein